MAEIVFKAFLSCSFSDEDKEITEFFKKLIRSFGIEPMVYDYQEIGKVPDKVKEHIDRSDCLIALATKREKIEDSDSWAYADWIQHEITIANAYNKPIAILVEDGVKIEGLIKMEERRETFTRDDLLRNIDKISTFLFNLRKYLESTYRSDGAQLPVMLRHYIHAKGEITSKDTYVLRSEILMESLIDELEATHHSIELEDTTPGLSIKLKQFDFACIEKPSNTRVNYEIILDTDSRGLWKVTFDPPLKKGEKVKYAFKSVRPNYRPWTYEEALERIRQGTYEYQEPICEAAEYLIAYPTAELSFDLEFPEGYELQKYYADVRIGEGVRLKSESELDRVKEGGFFTAEKMFDKWLLKLRVPKPIQGHVYYTFFEPPKTADLKQ
ncbi:MAG: hypothetical protein HN929_08475 [Chloroflexi bacterium]|jgi:hypothetical protein|nr:hypothetical protein [Chloroflexota bacterium]MBT7081485.1 hypothetical protein [Chloroflexota bacterium]MBT7290693.1 hypothetical protein [Chloroflexota bacterium]